MNLVLDASSRVESIRDTCIVEEEAYHEVFTFAGMRNMIIRKDGGGEKGFLNPDASARVEWGVSAGPGSF